MPSLTWIGKAAVQQLHRQIPYRLLRCDDARSVAATADGNLLVEGDNLHALKALLRDYVRSRASHYQGAPGVNP
jgi:hypothetical protein